MKAPIRAIGFDLGETLLFYRNTPLSWESRYPDALAAVARACGVSPTAAQFAAAAQVLKQHNTRIEPRTHEVSAEQILSSVLKTWSLDPAPDVINAIEAFFNYFRQSLSACPEAVSVLTELRESRVPIGILTDVPYGMPRAFVQRDLDGERLSRFFDAVLTSVEVGARKPEPAGYHTLAARLGVEPREMLYVGNEPKDIIGARRAGARSALLDREHSGANHGQDFTISTLAGVHDIMRNAGLAFAESKT